MQAVERADEVTTTSLNVTTATRVMVTLVPQSPWLRVITTGEVITYVMFFLFSLYVLLLIMILKVSSLTRPQHPRRAKTNIALLGFLLVAVGQVV